MRWGWEGNKGEGEAGAHKTTCMDATFKLYHYDH